MTVPFPIFSVDVVPVELTDKGRLMTKVVPLSLAWELVRLVVPFQSDRKPEDPVPVILPVEAEGVRREWLSMPYGDGPQQHFIWGATAGMLRNFYRFLSA